MIAETITAFNEHWWNNFLESTNILKKTKVFHNCMQKQETASMREDVMKIIRLIAINNIPEFGFRLYIEGKNIASKELSSFFENFAPGNDEKFEEWSERAFGDKKFGIIINRGEKFNPILVEKIAKKITPLTEKVGIPRLGVTFTIFIGNYGWTPLGIHTDGLGENVMHFHLGKGGKTMYTWDVETYEKLVEPANRFNNTKIEEILDNANVFDFEDGDIYFMPYGDYHVGKSDELSIGLTLWFNNHTESALARKVIDILLLNNLEESYEILPMDTSPYCDLENFEDVKKLFQNDFADKNFLTMLESTYRDYKMALYSNAGFWEPPFPKAEKIDHNLNFKIKIKEPFKIIYYSDSLLNLFIRGKKISLINNSSILDLIKKLNNGEELGKETVFNILDISWNLDIKKYVLDIFFENHIITVDYA